MENGWFCLRFYTMVERMIVGKIISWCTMEFYSALQTLARKTNLDPIELSVNTLTVELEKLLCLYTELIIATKTLPKYISSTGVLLLPLFSISVAGDSSDHRRNLYCNSRRKPRRPPRVALYLAFRSLITVSGVSTHESVAVRLEAINGMAELRWHGGQRRECRGWERGR